MVYSGSLAATGGVVLRPWNLGFRADYGLPGLQEPEKTERLLELIFTEGFRTDSDLPGVEKLAVTEPDSSWLDSPCNKLPPLAGSGGLCCKSSHDSATKDGLKVQSCFGSWFCFGHKDDLKAQPWFESCFCSEVVTGMISEGCHVCAGHEYCV